MISLIDRPPGLILSDTPAWFKVANTAEENKRVSAEISAQSGYITTVHAYASLQDTALFELSEVFASALSYQSDSLSTPGALHGVVTGDIIQEFSISFKDADGGGFTEQITVLLGFLTPDIFMKINYGSQGVRSISDYLSSSPILSFKPRHIPVHYPGQPEVFYLCSPQSLGVSVTVKKIFTDGSQSSSQAASFSVSANTLYYINASYAALFGGGQSPGTSPLAAYHVTISASGVPPVTYHFEVRFTARAEGSFLFYNALGGMDSFTPTGVTSMASGTSARFQRVTHPPGVRESLFKRTSHSVSHIVSCNTGYLSGDQARWLSQLVFSKAAFWHSRKGNTFPISIVSSNIDVKMFSPYLESGEIKFTYNPVNAAESLS